MLCGLLFRWAYVTQLNQAMAMKTHINKLERFKCTLGEAEIASDPRRGEGKNAGSLYWQLNDVWVAPSWSTIDAVGQWKMAHYLAVAATQGSPAIGRLIMTQTKGKVEIYWVPPIIRFSAKIQFELECWSIKKFRSPLRTISWMKFDTEVHFKCPLLFYDNYVSNVLTECNCEDPSQCILLARISARKKTVSDFLLFSRPREIYSSSAGSERARIKSVDATNNPSMHPPFPYKQAFRITVVSTTPELFVWLVVEPKLIVDAWFSDNGFHLITNNEHTVELFTKKELWFSAKELVDYIQVITLSSLY